MAAPYPQERIIEILTYARDHGVNQAARHFNMPRATITRWNKKFQIYTLQTAEYPIAKRKAVLQYAAQHGIKSAAKHFGVSTGIIERWNKELKIYKTTQRSFTHENRMEVLHYARDYGTAAAADKYDINMALIVEWNKRLHVYQAQNRYTEKEIIEILTFARDNGVTAAEQKFDVPGGTMLRWNQKYRIYAEKQMPDYTEYSETDRIKILKHAKKVYDALPEQTRSANYVFSLVSKEYHATPDQLRKWNKKHNIVPVRAHKTRKLTQAEIDIAQSALISARGHVARASRQSGISELAIKKLQTEKKISFEKGKAKMATNPPVGRRKSNAILGIIQMLMTGKNNQGKE